KVQHRQQLGIGRRQQALFGLPVLQLQHEQRLGRLTRFSQTGRVLMLLLTCGVNFRTEVRRLIITVVSVGKHLAASPGSPPACLTPDCAAEVMANYSVMSIGQKATVRQCLPTKSAVRAIDLCNLSIEHAGPHSSNSFLLRCVRVGVSMRIFGCYGVPKDQLKLSDLRFISGQKRTNTVSPDVASSAFVWSVRASRVFVFNGLSQCGPERVFVDSDGSKLRCTDWSISHLNFMLRADSQYV
ncbi:hypothetical protein BOX15_Mlig020624g3, partial [Macrostomum lignano]